MLFAALSGSSPATVVAIGSIVIAGMRQVGYSKDFAAGVICNAGTLGILIPPSIVMVVYASAVDVSVGRMFLAGRDPGLLAGLMLMTAIYVIAGPQPAQGRLAGWGEVLASGRDAGWGLFLIVIILGGIYGGVFHADRGRGGGGGLRLLHRQLRLSRHGAAAAATAAPRPAPCCCKSPGRWSRPSGSPGHQEHAVRGGQADDHADVHHRQRADPEACADRRADPAADRRAMLDAGFGPVMFLIDRQRDPADRRAVHGAVGADRDRGAAGVPDRHRAGVDPIHLGIIMVVNMEIGMITPPVGLNLFVTSGVAGMPMMRVVRRRCRSWRALRLPDHGDLHPEIILQ
jgi:C4-dicarboxylate transporter DctM subunit